MTLRELDVALKQLSVSVEQRADYMSVIEAELRAQQVRQALLPHSKPVSDGFIGSGFGWRSDPFSGEMSHHSGIDFAAPTGTPIHAAAGGVVVVAEYHPVWGNIVEVDHGNSLLSRYAHASRLNVAPGDIVKRGQKLAEVGSTGRSTGSHLHFEVHHQGVAQNPAKFLFAKAVRCNNTLLDRRASTSRLLRFGDASKTSFDRSRGAQALGGAGLPGRRALKCQPLRYSQRRREIRLKRYFA